jgi:hypothetical protein
MQKGHDDTHLLNEDDSGSDTNQDSTDSEFEQFEDKVKNDIKFNQLKRGGDHFGSFRVDNALRLSLHHHA